MGGIIRWSEGGIRPFATLEANGWVRTHNQLPYFAVYQRGDEVIELERDGIAFYSLGDRRVTNGTWESIVERFAVDLGTVAVLSKAQLSAVIDQLGEWSEGKTLTDDDVATLNNGIVTLLQYRNTLEDRGE